VQSWHWTIVNYKRFFTEAIYWHTLVHSVVFVTVASGIAVVSTFPFAYFVALRVAPQRRMVWILIAILPFSTSYLIRVVAWMTLLGDGGIINSGLRRAHLISDPLSIFGYNRYGIVLTFIYLLFPLSFLMTYVAIERMDPALLDSASDLGARPWETLSWIVIPIAKTGLLAGFALCFISIIGDYVTPTLIGGTSGTLFANLVVNQFGFANQWGFGSALAFILLVSTLALLVVARWSTGTVHSVGEFSRGYIARKSRLLRLYSYTFLIVLYAPVAVLVLFALNESDLVGFPLKGFTLHWFAVAINDPYLIAALRTSVTIAACAVGLSVVIGTPAAVQLARSRGWWRNFSIGVLALPLCLPVVMLGLGIVIGLHALGVTRGIWTIILGHTLLMLPVVVFTVLVRLEGLDPNLELAAMDLGANPWQTFLRITAPQAFPGIVAAALIGFALSMDEFILTFLVTGTQVTLPLFIYSSIHYNNTPELNALSSMMLAATFGLCGIAALILRGREGITRVWRRASKRSAIDRP
jgi:ABC-type spermidine/putrescine transport system permease subunit II